MHTPLVLLVTPVAGAMLGVGALAAADPTAATDPGSLAPYISGGGAAAAVSGLLWVLKKLLDGSLVPQQVRDQQIELGSAIVAAAQREDRVMKLAEDMTSLLRDVREENRTLRRALEQSLTDLERALAELGRKLP
jgi:hypothetical protein